MSSGTVIHVCDFGAPYLGNFMPSELALGDAVRDRLGLDVRFVFPKRARSRAWIAEVERRGFEFSFLDDDMDLARRARALRSLARSHHAAILHSHFFTFDLDCVAAAAGTPCRVVWHVHSGLEEYTPRHRLTDLVKVRVAGRRCDMVVAVSEATAADSRRRGFGPRKVRVVPNGIVLDRFRTPPDRDEARRRLGLAPEDFALLAFCWTPQLKGADLICAAVDALRRSDGGSRVVALLTGEARTREYIDGLYGGTPPAWVRIVEPVEDPAWLYAAADVFVSASRWEGFSYAMGEAMAVGLPVISSDIPGTSHYFAAEGVATFPSGDADALRGALAAIVASGRRARLGEGNRRLAFESLGVEHHVDRTIATYGELLGSTSRGRRLGRRRRGPHRSFP